MRKYIAILAAVVLFILSFRMGVYADEIVWQDIGRGNLNLKSVLVHPDNPRIIYIGSNNSIFKTEDGGEFYRSILSVKGQSKVVNFILCGPKDKNSLYAATAGGLFYSSNQGQAWNRIFQGKNSQEKECTSIAILSTAIYLGTKGGLFISQDKGRNWHKELGKLGNSHILAIASDIKEPDYIYVACVEGVFKTQTKGKEWERIFAVSPTENNNNHEDDEDEEDQDREERFSNLRYIAIDPNNLNCLYLATSRGVYQSQDRGKNWKMLSEYGLLSKDVRFLLVSPKSCLYVLTKSGVFEYRNGRWQELSFGLFAEEVSFLAYDNKDNLYAACDKGLFKGGRRSLINVEQDNLISLYFKDEPGIDKIQRAAMKYAEVEPEKILRWRKQAKMKAILPRLTVGLDRSENTNYEIYTSTTTHYVYEGPNDKSNGWDVALSWELGDLIYNNDQTSIDVRSRLLVQLRDDILDEVTKLYFERLRVKNELDNLSLEDRKKRFEKELRLQELTAYLDALTGGYFSQQISNRS